MSTTTEKKSKRQEKLEQREREHALAAGRLAQRQGKARDANPYRRPGAERSVTTDWLRAAWDAGYDFEVC